MLPSLDRPLAIVWTVAEGEEMVAFRLWSCSSTLVLLEQGLEGTLAVCGSQVAGHNAWDGTEATEPLLAGDGREVKLLQLQWCLHSFWVPSLYREKRLTQLHS
jgi:hypothetical protein